MLENEIKELTAALKENTATMKQMNEGRAEALAALQADAKAGGTTTTTRKPRAAKAAETAAATETPAAAAADTKSGWTPDTSVEGLRNLISPYLNVEDPDEKKARSGNLRAVLEHLGADVINPLPNKPEAKALEGDDARRQAAFYMTRFIEGLTVDFNADYDFNADPCSQGDPEPAAAAEAPAEDDLLG